jgi:hypothetical protein
MFVVCFEEFRMPSDEIPGFSKKSFTPKVAPREHGVGGSVQPKAPPAETGQQRPPPPPSDNG